MNTRRQRVLTVISAAAVLIGSFFVSGIGAVADVSESAYVHSEELPYVVPIDLPGGATGFVDERKGLFDVQAPGIVVPGLRGEDMTIGVTYRQELFDADPHGLGRGWTYSGSFVDSTSVVRVFLPTGGSYEYDASLPSGMSGYEGSDLRFEKPIDSTAALSPRPGVRGDIVYSYALIDMNTGTTQYFDATGRPLAVVNDSAPEERVDWIWDESNPDRLETVVDSSGTRTSFVNTPDGMNIVGSDGRVVAMEKGPNHLDITATSGEKLQFSMRQNGELIEFDIFTDNAFVEVLLWITDDHPSGLPIRVGILNYASRDYDDWTLRHWTNVDAGPGRVIREYTPLLPIEPRFDDQL